MKNKNRWKKWMKKTCSQPRVMCQSKQKEKLSINRNTTCSYPKGMFPLGIETILDCTFFIPFQIVFYLNLIFQNSYV